MLPERVFAIGGWLSIATGGLLAMAVVLNPNAVLWNVLPPIAFFEGLGAFFLYVGKGAHRDRRNLLDAPQRPP